MLSGITSVTVYVKSQAEAKAFWVDKVGFVVKAEMPMGEDGTWLTVGPKDAPTALLLYSKELMQKQMPEQSTAHPDVLFGSADAEAAHKELVDKGVKATEVKKDFWGTWFQFNDQDGNQYMVIQPAVPPA